MGSTPKSHHTQKSHLCWLGGTGISAQIILKCAGLRGMEEGRKY